MTVRVVVVDDSVTARTLLAEVLAADPEVEVVGQAADGVEALALVRRRRPSVVVMDIEMPELDGFETTSRIMSELPTPVVIVTAHHDPRSVAVCLQATRLGALTVQPKPLAPGAPGASADHARFVALVKALADVRVVRRRVSSPTRPVPAPDLPPATGDATARCRATVVGVAASTGGPAALYRLLGSLPRNLPVPVLVVQHIAEGFVDGLIRWLATGSALPVHLAVDGAPARIGHVYVAPDGAHLAVAGDGTIIRLVRSGRVGGFRPSASVLFSSLAVHHRAGALAVVLTGMGADGLDGVRDVRRAGGYVLAQSEETSAVFGMPRAVADAGLAHEVGGVEQLAVKIRELSSDA